MIVEDIVTSGGQIAISANQLRQLDAQIDSALWVIDGEQGVGVVTFRKSAKTNE
jgi:orotate phosphoribosyltransferase